MARSKQPRLFTTEDGRKARFNQLLFHYHFNEAFKNYKPDHGKRGGKTAFARTLAQKLVDSDNETLVESEFLKMKQWYLGNNGPNSLEEIYKLAEALELDKLDALLKYETGKGETKMNLGSLPTDGANASHSPAVTPETRYVFVDRQSDVRIEKQEAHKLYCLFVDLITDYTKTDVDVWVNLNRGTPEWTEAAKSYPNRVPVLRAIQKSSFFVPKDVRHAAYGLLEEMYGSYFFDFEEADPSNPFDGIAEIKHKQFEQYLLQHDKDWESCKDDTYEFTSFIFDQVEMWDYKLDEVFSDYLCD